ncbi:MAG: hypothetical protein ACBZ72_02935 [Candidatus Bathyarchaeia archaeon]
MGNTPYPPNNGKTSKVFARRMLVSTEIVTDTPHELTLQVLLSYPEFSIQSALRRMSIIAKRGGAAQSY